MDLNVLLQALGYLRSKRHWITPETADSRLSHHYRLAQRAGEEAGEQGFSVYLKSPARLLKKGHWAF